MTSLLQCFCFEQQLNSALFSQSIHCLHHRYKKARVTPLKKCTYGSKTECHKVHTHPWEDPAIPKTQTWVHSGITQIPFKPIQGIGVIPIAGHSWNGNGVGIEWELYSCLILN